ncbi:MAG TPA: diacylglycerol kinase family protein [Candidatus Saccharimonadales bacterium]|nr:diacylglycerol kinase family protein [Candidatus Saccharimonadales bacterium]
MAAFERAVVLTNPMCTRAKSVRRRVAELADSPYGRHLEVIPTKPDREATEEKIRQCLQPGDVLCVAGGDGTVNTAIRSANVPILPLWGGNGNDLAHMLNGRPVRRPSRLLERAEVVPIRPIRGDISIADENTTEIAGSYAGFGAGALGALRLDDGGHRKKIFYSIAAARMLYEADLLLKSLAEAQPFTVTRDGEKQSVYDITLANGPRIAKVGRLPVQLTEERCFAFETTDKSFMPITQRMGALAIGRPSGSYITDKTYDFTVHEPVLAHFDAEPQILPPDTHVSLSLAEEPFYAVTTRLGVHC